MNKPHRAIRTSKSRTRKFTGKCEGCSASICSCKAYQYVDESNQAITDNSPYLCRKCYEERHSVVIRTPEQSFKERLADRFTRIAENEKDAEKAAFLQRMSDFILAFE